MIFIFGVAFCIAGLIALVILLRKVRRPKADGTIKELTMDYVAKDKQQIKKHPHAVIIYNYRSVDYTAKILLLKRKTQIGEQVVVSFKEDVPEKPSMYAPKQEAFVFIILMSLGLGLIGASVFIMDYFNLK